MSKKKAGRKSNTRTARRPRQVARDKNHAAAGRGRKPAVTAVPTVPAPKDAAPVTSGAPTSVHQQPRAAESERHEPTIVPKRGPTVSMAPDPGSDPAAELRSDPAAELPESGQMLPSRGCAAAVNEMEPQGLVATYELPREREQSLAIAFSGVRIGSAGREHSGDGFERVVTADHLPSTGRATVSVRVSGIKSGTWQVVSTPVNRNEEALRQTVTTTTRLAPLAVGPGVRIAAWPLLVGVGALTALATQAILFARIDSRWWVATLLSVLGCLVGVLGAKVWFLALHRERRRSLRTAGACIQGFIVAAVGTVIVGALTVRLPVGALLDATTPGLFLGMAIGRPGCFLSGCCAGRPTSSRWGLWSSDRQLGVRRYPVQLLEAAGALLLAVISLVLVLTVRPHWQGTLFVGAMICYILVRQLLFPLRSDPHTARGRTWTVAASLAVLTLDVAAAAA